MSQNAFWNASRALAVAWLVVVLAITVHQWRFWQSPVFDTDVFALLPQEEHIPTAQLAMKRLAEQGERRIVVAIRGLDWGAIQAAAKRFDTTLVEQRAGLRVTPVADGMDQAVDFYRPWREALLTDNQRQHLSSKTPEYFVDRAINRLHGIASGQPTSWLEDPLGLWPDWLSQRAQITAARPRDGLLWVNDGQHDWAVLLYETEGSPFRLDGEPRWSEALERASLTARASVADGALRILTTGVPLHAEAGAAQGRSEMNTIGWGSLMAVTLLVWYTFRSVRPVALIAVSLFVGCAAALSITLLVFGRVHVLTLVFGASLVGVAEDFGIHYFASRLASPKTERWALMKHLLPGLLLALITSMLGYLVLAVVPFPGLRQMALFSTVGMAAAMLTTICWFPYLDRGSLPGSRLASWIAASLQRWPRLSKRELGAVIAVFTLFCSVGVYRVQVSDDLRQLQSSPPELIQTQIELGQLLKIPSPAQFFLLQRPSPEALLQTEEQLKSALEPLLAQLNSKGDHISLSAISDWLPSAARQAENRALSARIEVPLLNLISQQLDEDLRRPTFAIKNLDLQTWLDSPVSQGMRAQWLGKIDENYVSVVLIRSLNQREHADALRIVGEQVPGVRWIDRSADMSALLGRFRGVIGWLLVLGHVAIWIALMLRYGRSGSRAWIPTALASIVCVAVQGWLGEPFQLFSLLALLLLLGVGVDYGIFLLEHQDDGQGYAWLAVLIGALSTGLSFGLLALSKTPALHAYGLTLLVGLVTVCVLAPYFRRHGGIEKA